MCVCGGRGVVCLFVVVSGVDWGRGGGERSGGGVAENYVVVDRDAITFKRIFTDIQMILSCVLRIPFPLLGVTSFAVNLRRHRCV